MLLTAYCRRIEKCLHYFGIHIDSEVSLLHDAGISIVNSLLNPLCKHILDGGVDDVTEPLLWELFPFLLIGEVSEAFLVFGDELLDLLHA